MTTRRPTVVLVLAVLLLPLAAALAMRVPPRPTGRVTDLAGLLSPEDRRAIEERLAAFEHDTTDQVAVLTIPSLEGEPIEPFSHQVATTWKLGQAGVDNGVLLLIVPGDRRVRIEVGYGLEPVLPDGLNGDIIRETIAPSFRRGEYAAGINQALDRIFAAARTADLSAVAARRAMDARRGLADRLFLYLVVGFAVIGLAHPFARRFLGSAFWTLFAVAGAAVAGAAIAGLVPWQFLGGWVGLGIGLGVMETFVEEQNRCPRCGAWMQRAASVPAGRGAEVIVTTCPRCGFRSRTTRQLAGAAGAATGFWLGSGGGWMGGGWGGGGWGGGGGGGFSGGGGDFGGGGASGSW